MPEEDALDMEGVQKMLKCSRAQASRHRKAVRTMKNYGAYALLTRSDFNEWRELYNTLTPAERKMYFKGFKS